MLPDVRRSKPLRFWLRYSTTEGTKKCSGPSAPNSGNARASAAVMTRGAPPEASCGPSTATADRPTASAAKRARPMSIRGRPPSQPSAETHSTPTASTAAGGYSSAPPAATSAAASRRSRSASSTVSRTTGCTNARGKPP